MLTRALRGAQAPHCSCPEDGQGESDLEGSFDAQTPPRRSSCPEDGHGERDLEGSFGGAYDACGASVSLGKQKQKQEEE